MSHCVTEGVTLGCNMIADQGSPDQATILLTAFYGHSVNFWCIAVSLGHHGPHESHGLHGQPNSPTHCAQKKFYKF